jgi:hypothetical protein
MIGRKISDNFSLQLSGNLSWFNYKEPMMDDEGVPLGTDQNMQISASAIARYKLSSVFGLIVEYDSRLQTRNFSIQNPTSASASNWSQVHMPSSFL